MRSVVIALVIAISLTSSTSASTSGRATFVDVVAGANACLRDDMIQAPPDAVLFRYSPCLGMVSFIEDVRTWYGGSYPATRSQNLEAATTLTLAAGDLVRALLWSPDGLWRADVLTLLDLSDAYLADEAVANQGDLKGSDEDEVVFAAILSATTSCLEAIAAVDRDTVGRGGEWTYVHCIPITNLVGDQLVDASQLADLPPDLMSAAELTAMATGLTSSLTAPVSNAAAADEMMSLIQQANGYITAWETLICEKND